ncbi:MAG: ATP-binding protein [Roseiarcus sp.]
MALPTVKNNRFTGPAWKSKSCRANTILDRLVHNAHRLHITGESMRKTSARNRPVDTPEKP